MTDGNKKLGYISIYRSIKDHWLWQDPVKFQWWISLLLEVNFKDKKVMLGNDLIMCKRGQTVKSLQHFANLWNTTRDTARNFLVLLEEDGMILRKNLHKSTQITICNYDSYQDGLHTDQTQTKQEPNANQTHFDTNNNVNNSNNDNNVKSIVAYLNERTNSQFKSSTSKTISLIKARTKDGYSEEDFKKVIDVKAKEWMGDKNQEKYLRPETLFGTKFEGYFNQAQKSKKSSQPENFNKSGYKNENGKFIIPGI